MAVPFIQLGQCGNQVGEALFERMYQEGCKASAGHQAMLSYFFDESPKGNVAKAFLIDMEPKVVNKNLNMQRSWKYNKDYSVVQEEGSGNNWAYGCRIHGPRVSSKILNRIRKMFEEEDYVKCMFQIQSLAGGTGSGLGTFIMQLLGENFPKLEKINICIMPHLSG
jgi:tubulin delta